MFTINSITILPECQHRKNLKDGKIAFGDFLPGFYGDNITVHAIVGKNGSGKSALLELMFRMINNFGAAMCKDVFWDREDNLAYVAGIYADLEYSKTIDGNEQMEATQRLCHGKLCIRDKAMWLVWNGEVYWLNDCSDFLLYDDNGPYKNEINNAFERQVRLEDDFTLSKLQPLADMFFYTIATNYSILGFLSSDFEDEDSWEYKTVYVRNVDATQNDSEDVHGLQMWVESKNWMNKLFHKNDGYLSPIVLNPYRKEGNIDMDTEAELTSNRLSALLLSNDHVVSSIIEGYSLDSIEYTLDTSFYRHFTPRYKKGADGKMKNSLADGGCLKLFRDIIGEYNSYASIILDQLQVGWNIKMNDIEMTARMYLVYKVLSIAQKYPAYEEYRKFGNVDNIFECCDDLDLVQFKALVDDVRNHQSHIEMKVHQMLSFINACEQHGEMDYAWMIQPFTHTEYMEKLEIHTQGMSLEELMCSLPPSIFRQNIFLKRKIFRGHSNAKFQWAKRIPLGHLSSGERQFLYQMSTLVYHLLNLCSVSEDSVKYHDVNIVLDEIEVCFHPEYQQKFLSRLLKLLDEGLGINSSLNIHIWLTTHSPFILSDLAQKNITYLENGRWLKEVELRIREMINPLLANVNDILYHSFFLNHGFSGIYAQKKVLSLLDFLKGKNHDWTKESAKMMIENVGERLMKRMLTNLYQKKYEENID